MATEVLKHFVFVIPPIDDPTLLDEKKELEGDSDLFLNAMVAKVRNRRLVLNLAGFIGQGRKATPTRQQSGSDMRLVSLLPEEPL